MKAIKHRRVLDIETGMIVTTSYGSGPYVITEILGPFRDGTITLVLVGAPGTHYERVGGNYWINNIYQATDGRYMSGPDVIMIAPNPTPVPQMLSLFDLEEAA